MNDQRDLSDEETKAAAIHIANEVGKRVNVADNVPVLPAMLHWYCNAYMAEEALLTERPELRERFERLRDELRAEAKNVMAELDREERLKLARLN